MSKISADIFKKNRCLVVFQLKIISYYMLNFVRLLLVTTNTNAMFL